MENEVCLLLYSPQIGKYIHEVTAEDVYNYKEKKDDEFWKSQTHYKDYPTKYDTKWYPCDTTHPITNRKVLVFLGGKGEYCIATYDFHPNKEAFRPEGRTKRWIPESIIMFELPKNSYWTELPEFRPYWKDEE